MSKNVREMKETDSRGSDGARDKCRVPGKSEERREGQGPAGRETQLGMGTTGGDVCRRGTCEPAQPEPLAFPLSETH